MSKNFQRKAHDIPFLVLLKINQRVMWSIWDVFTSPVPHLDIILFTSWWAFVWQSSYCYITNPHSAPTWRAPKLTQTAWSPTILKQFSPLLWLISSQKVLWKHLLYKFNIVQKVAKITQCQVLVQSCPSPMLLLHTYKKLPNGSTYTFHRNTWGDTRISFFTPAAAMETHANQRLLFQTVSYSRNLLHTGCFTLLWATASLRWIESHAHKETGETNTC